MRFRKKLYLGKTIKQEKLIRWKLRMGVGMADIYVISLARGGDQLEYAHCCFFKQRLIRRNVGLIVGLARGRQEAGELVVAMVEDALKATGEPRVKQFLLDGA